MVSGKIIAGLIKLVDDISDDLSQDNSTNSFRKRESVVAFYARFCKFCKIYAFFYDLKKADIATELACFRDRLR